MHYRTQIYRNFEVFLPKYFRKLTFKQYSYPKSLYEYKFPAKRIAITI